MLKTRLKKPSQSSDPQVAITKSQQPCSGLPAQAGQIYSIAWVDGGSEGQEKTIFSGKQWVNLPRDECWTQGGDISLDRLGLCPRLKVTFDREGEHPFTAGLLPPEGTPAYSKDEEERHSGFCYEKQTKDFITDSDGTKIIDAFQLVAGGGYQFRAWAQDSNKKSATTGPLETWRMLYFVEGFIKEYTKPLENIEDIENIYAKHFVCLKRLPSLEIPYARITNTEESLRPLYNSLDHQMMNSPEYGFTRHKALIYILYCRINTKVEEVISSSYRTTRIEPDISPLKIQLHTNDFKHIGFYSILSDENEEDTIKPWLVRCDFVDSQKSLDISSLVSSEDQIYSEIKHLKKSLYIDRNKLHTKIGEKTTGTVFINLKGIKSLAGELDSPGLPGLIALMDMIPDRLMKHKRSVIRGFARKVGILSNGKGFSPDPRFHLCDKKTCVMSDTSTITQLDFCPDCSLVLKKLDFEKEYDARNVTPQVYLTSVGWINPKGLDGENTEQNMLQCINLTQENKWLDNVYIKNIERAGRKPLLKVSFNTSGSHKFTLAIDRRLSSLELESSLAEEKYTQDSVEYITDPDGSRMIDDFPLGKGGGRTLITQVCNTAMSTPFICTLGTWQLIYLVEAVLEIQGKKFSWGLNFPALEQVKREYSKHSIGIRRLPLLKIPIPSCQPHNGFDLEDIGRRFDEAIENSPFHAEKKEALVRLAYHGDKRISFRQGDNFGLVSLTSNKFLWDKIHSSLWYIIHAIGSALGLPRKDSRLGAENCRNTSCVMKNSWTTSPVFCKSCSTALLNLFAGIEIQEGC